MVSGNHQQTLPTIDIVVSLLHPSILCELLLQCECILPYLLSKKGQVKSVLTIQLTSVNLYISVGLDINQIRSRGLNAPPVSDFE